MMPLALQDFGTTFLGKKNFGGDERRTFDEGKAKHTNDQKKIIFTITS